MNQPTLPVTIGRYVLAQPIARGGMATVHAARFVAAEGITRLVAAKRLHPQFTDDPEFVEMFQDEARIASRIHHPNVVPVLDVILDRDEVILVQEYVHGVPLSYLFKLALANKTPVPKPIAITIAAGVLAGLHAAHEATDDVGEPLNVVHRDVSPQNVIVSVDGIPRLLDFGIAKARTSMHHTREGFFKGKLAYMAPEQLRAEPVTRAADIYAAGILLWELVVNRRFYDGKNDADFIRAVAVGTTPSPTQILEGERASIPDERWADIVLLEPIIARATSTDPANRYPTAREMATALLDSFPSASAADVAAWVRTVGLEYLEKRQNILSSDDSRTGQRTFSRSFELANGRSSDDRISGARLKVDVDERSVKSESRIVIEQAAPLVGAPQHPARAIVPWVLVAALLAVVGLLTGMVIVREPTAAAREPTAAAREPAPTVYAVAAAPVPTVAAPPALEPEPTPVVGSAGAPTAAVPATSAASPASARPTTPPLPVVRFVAPVKTPPMLPPRATSAPTASTKADCNPPFYFDGTKKIFKPACL